MAARGVLFVHSCPPALRPHVEWAVAGVLGIPVRLEWDVQPLAPDCLRAQTGWRGPVGTASRIAAAMRDWPLIRCEVTEPRSGISSGSRGCEPDSTYCVPSGWPLAPGLAWCIERTTASL